MPFKRTTLNAWQMLALDEAMNLAVERGAIDQDSIEHLRDLITEATKITVTKDPD